MDIDADNQSQQPISDDQELAKALAGISDQPEVPAEEPAVAAPAPVVPDDAAAADSNGDLDGVKRQAIDELRPLVGKLNISPEEKFDTYLLLLRSTDDRSLVAPAHEVATQIEDEARRAQALLDIIKEIDYFSNPTQQQ